MARHLEADESWSKRLRERGGLGGGGGGGGQVEVGKGGEGGGGGFGGEGPSIRVVFSKDDDDEVGGDTKMLDDIDLKYLSKDVLASLGISS